MIGDKAIKFQFDSISLPYEGEYAAWHKISDGHFGNELHYHDHYEIFFFIIWELALHNWR